MKELLELLSKENEELENKLFKVKSEFEDYRDAKWSEINNMKIEWGQERHLLVTKIHKLNIQVAERDCRIEELMDELSILNFKE